MVNDALNSPSIGPAVEAPTAGSVTAIVPARNEEAVIAACIASLASQPEIGEILVVNDQSTDGTASVVKSLSLANRYGGRFQRNVTLRYVRMRTAEWGFSVLTTALAGLFAASPKRYEFRLPTFLTGIASFQDAYLISGWFMGSHRIREGNARRPPSEFHGRRRSWFRLTPSKLEV
jgi:glycosyltransferase involved in cell wall biosynthesis